MTAPSGAVDSGEEIFLAPRGVALRSAYGLPTRNAAGPLASPASYTTSWDAPGCPDHEHSPSVRCEPRSDRRRSKIHHRRFAQAGTARWRIQRFCRAERTWMGPAPRHVVGQRQSAALVGRSRCGDAAHPGGRCHRLPTDALGDASGRSCSNTSDRFFTHASTYALRTGGGCGQTRFRLHRAGKNTC